MTDLVFRNTVLPLKDKLFRFSYSYLKDTEEAKDVVQDVMIKVWEELNKDKKIDNIAGWCMTCTRNKSLDRMKKKSFHQPSIDDQYDISYQGGDPSVLLENKEMLEKVDDIINQLSSKQKEMVRLRDFEGMSYQEIEDFTGLPMNQVKVNLFRARKYIKEKMDKVMKYGLS